jgi:hypothetical protein
MPKKTLPFKKILIILAIAFFYWFLLTEALSIPLCDPPPWFTSLFTNKMQALIFWQKGRHTATVGIVAIAIGFITLKALRKNALIGGIIVGMLVAIFTAIYDYFILIRYDIVHNFSSYLNLRLHEPGIPAWVLPSDLIVIAGAAPMAVVTLSHYCVKNKDKPNKSASP